MFGRPQLHAEADRYDWTGEAQSPRPAEATVRVGFGTPVAWAVGLGLFSAAVAGSVVPAMNPGQEVRHILGFSLVFVPAVYLLVTRRHAAWQRKHPYVRFVLFTLSMVVGTVVLVRFAVFLVGTDGSVARAVAFLAAVSGFCVGAWMTFFGGGERLWALFLSRTDTRW